MWLQLQRATTEFGNVCHSTPLTDLSLIMYCFTLMIVATADKWAPNLKNGETASRFSSSSISGPMEAKIRPNTLQDLLTYIHSYIRKKLLKRYTIVSLKQLEPMW